MSKKNKQKRPALVQIMFLTLITVLTWVSFEVYNTVFQKSDFKTLDKKILEPIDPSLNTELLENLNLRIYLNQNQIEDNLLIEPEEPEPTATPLPEQTPQPEEGVAQPSPTPEPETKTVTEQQNE